jgi:hypothetical protein
MMPALVPRPPHPIRPTFILSGLFPYNIPLGSNMAAVPPATEVLINFLRVWCFFWLMDLFIISILDLVLNVSVWGKTFQFIKKSYAKT